MKRIFFCLLIIVFLAHSNAWAIRRSTLDERLVRSTESFENVINSKTGEIPPSILSRAQGILIFREYGGGFIFGGKGGFGVAMERQRDGRWGPPAFFKMFEGSFGFQIGVQRLDIVFLFMNRESLRVLERGKFRIGVDVAAAAGPVGANAEAKIGAPVLVYSDNAGLYAGAAFEGGVLGPDDEANDAYYERMLAAGEILSGRVRFPPTAESLRSMLENYERNGERMLERKHEQVRRSYYEEEESQRPWESNRR